MSGLILILICAESSHNSSISADNEEKDRDSHLDSKTKLSQSDKTSISIVFLGCIRGVGNEKSDEGCGEKTVLRIEVEKLNERKDDDNDQSDNSKPGSGTTDVETEVEKGKDDDEKRQSLNADSRTNQESSAASGASVISLDEVNSPEVEDIDYDDALQSQINNRGDFGNFRENIEN